MHRKRSVRASTFVVWAIILAETGTVNLDNLAPFNRCSGSHGHVGADIWAQVKDVQYMDIEGRKLGVIVDLRSDSLESFYHIFKGQVLLDLDGAIRDCAFGVVSLILLTLHIIDEREGIERAREMKAIADDLYFKFAELAEDSSWPIDPNLYYGHRLLLGMHRSTCAGTHLRIFIYNTPLTKKRLTTGFGMMGAASHVHAFLENGPCITKDPKKADLFYIPAYHGVQYEELFNLLQSPHVAEMFPHLARRRGADHFFVVGANLPSWDLLAPLRQGILLTVESHQVNDGIPRYYNAWKDIMIPGYIDRFRIASMRSFNKPTDKRGFLVVFHGNHPGTHQLYVKFNADVRTKILETFAGIPDCSVGGHVPDFFERMGRSHFCLVPRGSSAWTIHLYESFFFGCIPVILSDHLELPFQELVDWPRMSIKWPEDRVGTELLEHLRSIPLERVAEMKGALERAACFFDFHRGWGAEGTEGWLSWGDGFVALGTDCGFLGHADSSSLDACRQNCEQQTSCNLVNFRGVQDDGDDDFVGPQCVLRSCEDAAQPSLTGVPRHTAWQVWSLLRNDTVMCSPYAAILRSLEARVQHHPFTHGAEWS